MASVPYTTASQLYTAHLVSAKKITADDAAKCTLQLSFRVEVCYLVVYIYIHVPLAVLCFIVAFYF